MVEQKAFDSSNQHRKFTVIGTANHQVTLAVGIRGRQERQNGWYRGSTLHSRPCMGREFFIVKEVNRDPFIGGNDARTT